MEEGFHCGRENFRGNIVEVGRQDRHFVTLETVGRVCRRWSGGTQEHAHHIRASGQVPGSQPVADALGGKVVQRGEGSGKFGKKGGPGGGDQFEGNVNLGQGDPLEDSQGGRGGYGEGSVVAFQGSMSFDEGGGEDVLDPEEVQAGAGTHDIDDRIDGPDLMEMDFLDAFSVDPGLGLADSAEDGNGPGFDQIRERGPGDQLLDPGERPSMGVSVLFPVSVFMFMGVVMAVAVTGVTVVMGMVVAVVFLPAVVAVDVDVEVSALNAASDLALGPEVDMLGEAESTEDFLEFRGVQAEVDQAGKEHVPAESGDAIKVKCVCHKRRGCQRKLTWQHFFLLTWGGRSGTLDGQVMNIHEYQAKELLEKFGVATPKGQVARTPDEADQISRPLGNRLVVKAQIHAGGRGKGTFKSGFKGGVQLAKTASQARDFAAQMIGQVLVTHQTGPEGKLVRNVLVAESVDIDREIYFAILMDRATSRPVIIASQQGGMDIEEVAARTPEAIFREPVNPALGLQPYQARKLSKLLGFSSAQMRDSCRLFHATYRLFIESDCSMVEINPLVVTKGGEVLALDAKLNFDDNALFRQEAILAMRDESEEDPREVAASKVGLNYIGLDGNIGCMVNGAGLAMATMDIIKHYGGDPANFLDVGGGANEQQVTEAFKILVADSQVKAILVNIFGGIMKCDIIARGIIAAVKTVGLKVPLVVRLEGTNVEEGRKLLKESGLDLIAANQLSEAAEKVVLAVKGK